MEIEISNLTLLCPYGCNSFVNPNKFQEHVDLLHCDSRGRCSTCNKEILIEDFPIHMKTCKAPNSGGPKPKKISLTKGRGSSICKVIKCDNCGKQLLKKNLTRHLLSCKAVDVSEKPKSKVSVSDNSRFNAILNSRNNEVYNNSTVDYVIIMGSKEKDLAANSSITKSFKCGDCGMEMLKKNYSRHLSRCNLKKEIISKMAKCKSCGKECLKKNISRHMLSCPGTVLADNVSGEECEKCGREVLECDKEQHEELCLYLAVKTKCKNCKKYIAKDNLARHLRLCLLKGINDEEMSFSDDSDVGFRTDSILLENELDLKDEFKEKKNYIVTEEFKDDENNIIEDISKNYVQSGIEESIN